MILILWIVVLGLAIELALQRHALNRLAKDTADVLMNHKREIVKITNAILHVGIDPAQASPEERPANG